MKFGINFTSCSEYDSGIARGAAVCNFAVLATRNGINHKISLLLVLSQINTIASFTEVKISSNSLPQRVVASCCVIPAKHTVKVENRSGRLFCVHSASLSSLVVADSFP